MSTLDAWCARGTTFDTHSMMAVPLKNGGRSMVMSAIHLLSRLTSNPSPAARLGKSKNGGGTSNSRYSSMLIVSSQRRGGAASSSPLHLK